MDKIDGSNKENVWGPIPSGVFPGRGRGPGRSLYLNQIDQPPDEIWEHIGRADKSAALIGLSLQIQRNYFTHTHLSHQNQSAIG